VKSSVSLKQTQFVAMKAKPFIPARLEVRTKDGLTLIETFRILREPDLQAQCLEKRELRRIMKILQVRGALPEQGRHGSTQTARSPSSALSRR
jgi:hypothetical protein